MSSARRRQIIGAGGGAPINKSRRRPQIVGGGAWLYFKRGKPILNRSIEGIIHSEIEFQGSLLRETMLLETGI